MIHYYVFKYWSRILVGTMVSAVVIVFGLFSYSLLSVSKTITTQTSGANAQSQQVYQKSVSLYGKIQELKVKKQDTTQLEALYQASVKNLSDHKQDEAETKLEQLETQIVKINESLVLTPSPVPTGVIASASGTLTPSEPVPSEAVDAASYNQASSSAR